MEKIFETLATDKANRVEKVEGDLFKLEDLNMDLDWDYSLPTIITSDSTEHLSLPKKFTKCKKFIKTYRKKYDILPTDKSFFDNVLIAGGSVSGIMQDDSERCDIDIFLYSLTSSVNPVISDPKDWYGNYYKSD